MNIFDEYLDPWEFDDRWHGFVVRAAFLTGPPEVPARQTPDPARHTPVLAECAIWPVPEWDESGCALLVWTDVTGTERGGGSVTLAGLLTHDGLHCGTISGHCPDDPNGADLTWAVWPMPADGSSAELADWFVAWLDAQAARPIRELVERRSEFVRRLR